MMTINRTPLLLGVLFLLSFGHFMSAQQPQKKMFTNADGSRELLDVATGWTEIDKSGKSTNLSAAELTNLCKEINEFPVLAQGKDGAGFIVACDEWGKLQPKTPIELATFSRLVTRLLLLTPPSTDFVRYRGYLLKSHGEAATYDSIILPDDLGKNVSCTIGAGPNPLGGMLYTYQCSIKTSSFSAAIQLKDHLVYDLESLNLSEDQVREHGLAAHSRDAGLCAPGGECMEEYVYATAMKDWKTLQIEANPAFTRNTVVDLMAAEHGKRAAIQGIASDAGSVSFEIFSAGPK